MYTVYTAIGYWNNEDELDYEGLIGIQVPAENTKDIKAAMSLMDFEIYRIEKGNEVLFESDQLLEIKQRRTEKMAGN